VRRISFSTAAHITLELMSEDIGVSDMLGELQAIARRFDAKIDVEAVSSIQDWCKGAGLLEDSSFLCGKTLQVRETGRHLVLLADPITADMRASVISGMEYHGRLDPEDIALLLKPLTFVKHLVLHEVAHATNHHRTEEECDRWAFEQLRVL
jgi:hypothetical protein